MVLANEILGEIDIHMDSVYPSRRVSESPGCFDSRLGLGPPPSKPEWREKTALGTS